MPVTPYRDRTQAGKVLAQRLTAYAGKSDVVVLALPRGGVPVAFEIAQALKAPLDVFVVRKLGVPGFEEAAMGAVASGGVRVLNDDLVQRLGLSAHAVDAVAQREQIEIERRELAYRDGRPPPDVRGKTVILVDDGLATGATMMAAIEALRKLRPGRIVVAVPTASPDTCEAIEQMVDEIVCATTPEPFHAVGEWYQDFRQVSDEEVRQWLAHAPQADPPPARAEGRSRGELQGVFTLTGAARDYDPLIERARHSRFVLLGEATHGTHEFYRERAEITKRLIEEHGFAAVAVEADWPDAFRINRFVRGESNDADAMAAMSDFERFPSWMWRNKDVVAFADWLRTYNGLQGNPHNKVGFYGLDLYSLHASMHAVIAYLERADPAAAARARERYACFDQYATDARVYGLMTHLNLSKTCEEEAIAQLVEMRQHTAAQARAGGRADVEATFNAEQNARLVANAETYYRTIHLEDISSWNVRDQHMAQTLDQIADHLSGDTGPAKIVVWAHNSHLGDARATEMGRRGELNVGQLVRRKYADKALLVGFSTDRGTVTAASSWGAEAERKQVRPGIPGSYEALFHQHGGDFMMIWQPHTAPDVLREARLQRAIGVIYRPDTERQSHYFHARLTQQFDAMLHFDETTAVEPLERTSTWEAGEVPDTFPFAL